MELLVTVYTKDPLISTLHTQTRTQERVPAVPDTTSCGWRFEKHQHPGTTKIGVILYAKQLSFAGLGVL
jgi:hypothetical protein